MWADMSQHEHISLSVEGVYYQLRRCLISVVSSVSVLLLTTALTGFDQLYWY